MLRDRSGRVCAMCEHFTLKDAADAARGRGRCTGFDTPPATPPAVEPAVKQDPMRDWNEHFCVLYTPAERMSVRKAWIVKIQQAGASAPITEGDSNGRADHTD